MTRVVLHSFGWSRDEVFWGFGLGAPSIGFRVEGLGRVMPSWSSMLGAHSLEFRASRGLGLVGCVRALRGFGSNGHIGPSRALWASWVWVQQGLGLVV